MRIARMGLLAALAVALMLAGCESEPVPPSETEKPAKEPLEKEVPEEGLAWAASQAPADACVVVTVASVAQLEKDLKALAGPDADELDMVRELDNDLPTEGLDPAGPLVLILPAAADETEPVLFLRIKDEAAIKGENAGAGILATKRSLGPEKGERSGYVLKMGPWAVIADSTDAIKAVMRAEKKVALSDDQRASIAGRAVWVHLNPPSLAAAGKRAFEKMQKQMAENPQAPGMPEVTTKMINWLLDVAKDATGVSAAADVKPEGITADVEVDMAEGSNLLAIANSGAPLKDYKVGLPTAQGLVLAVWAGMDWSKAMPAMQALIKPMFDIVAEGEDEKTRKALDDVWASYEKWGPVMGNRFGMVMETPKPGAGMYQLVETFTIKDTDQYRKLLKEYMQFSMDAMDVMMTKFTAMPGMPQVPNIKTETEYKEAAETVEGVPVDVWRIKFDVSLLPDAPPEAAEQLKNMLRTMYGPEGMVIRMAVVGNLGVVAMGDASVMARAIKAAKGQAPDLTTDPKVAAALKRVPEGEGAALISAANYTYMAMGMVDRMMIGSMPPEIKAEAEKAGIKPVAAPPPTDLITVSGGVEGRTVRVRIDVPASDIRAAVAVTKQGAERIEWYMKKQRD